MALLLEVVLRPGADSDTDAAEVAIYANPGSAFNSCLTAGEGIVEVIALHIHIPGFPGKGMGRTCFNASHTVSTMRDFDRHADIQPGIGEDCEESDGIAVLPGDQRGALADPAQTGARGNGLEGKGNSERLPIDVFPRYLKRNRCEAILSKHTCRVSAQIN